MADNPTFSNPTYAGEFFDENIAPHILNPAGLEDLGLATIIDRTKDKSTIYESDDTVDFQDASELFSDQGTTADTDEVNLVMVPYDFGKKLTLSALRTSWYSTRLAPGSLEDYTDDQLVMFYINEIYSKKLGLGQDNLVLNGKLGLDAKIGVYSFSAPYIGLYPLMNAASGINKVSIADDAIPFLTVGEGLTTTLIVASDVRTQLQVGNVISIRNAGGTGWDAINGDFKVLSLTATTVVINVDTNALTAGNYDGNATIQYINANNIIEKIATHSRVIPEVIYREDSTIVLPAHLQVEWNLAVGLANKDGGGFVLKAWDLQMIEKRLQFLDNAPANTLGTWLAKHVFYGYDLSTDFSNIEVLWQGATTGNKLYHIQGKMKTGIQITQKFQDEMTLSTPDA